MSSLLSARSGPANSKNDSELSPIYTAQPPPHLSASPEKSALRMGGAAGHADGPPCAMCVRLREVPSTPGLKGRRASGLLITFPAGRKTGDHFKFVEDSLADNVILSQKTPQLRHGTDGGAGGHFDRLLPLLKIVLSFTFLFGRDLPPPVSRVRCSRVRALRERIADRIFWIVGYRAVRALSCCVPLDSAVGCHDPLHSQNSELGIRFRSSRQIIAKGTICRSERIWAST